MKQRWRFQVDEYRPKGSKMYGARHQLFSHQEDADRSAALTARHNSDYQTKDQETTTVIPSEVDELVIDKWFHLEAMDTRSYWMSIGGLTVNVEVRKDGTAKHVMWELQAPQEGVTYSS